MVRVTNADKRLIGIRARILLGLQCVVRNLSAWPCSLRFTLAAIVTMASAGAPSAANAHNISISPDALARDVQRISDTLRFYRERDRQLAGPKTPSEQRHALGAAEIGLALGDTEGALQILMGRLADPNFAALPEYVDTLLMTSEILETQAQDVGAMLYAEQALRIGGTPEQMAEAGARWFTLARRNQRTDRVVEILKLWGTRGGAAAAGTETAAQVMYQVGFAMRLAGDLSEARAFLARVPAESAYGSRAAYLAGVLFVEDGDLAQAERWFAAVMDWAIVSPEGTYQYKVEAELRDLAALSTGRLLYEKGDLAGADTAYRRIAASSPFQREACWERAYLDLDRKKLRAALKRVQCVVDLGARGSRAVDARLFQASILGHMTQYDRSIVSYEKLHVDIVQQHKLFEGALANIGDKPAEFLFKAMERSAQYEEGMTSPGPATLFADSWTPEVNQAFRVDRAMGHAGDELLLLMQEIQGLAELVRNESTFGGLELRKKSLEVLLKEIRHFEGHTRVELQRGSQAHASTQGAVDHDHSAERQALRGLVDKLQAMGSAVEIQVVELDRDALRRREQAMVLLRELYADLGVIDEDLKALRLQADLPINGVVKQALGAVKADLSDAAMRAEFGLLDTYWLKKQHRTRSIESLLQMKQETERQVLEAIEDLSK